MPTVNDNLDDTSKSILGHEGNHGAPSSQMLTAGGLKAVPSESQVGIDVQSWLPEPSDIPSLGLAGSLFEVILSLCIIVDQRVAQTKHSRRLHSELERFFLWGDGLSVSEGQLDEVLSKSFDLRQTVISALYELGKVVKEDLLVVVDMSTRSEEPSTQSDLTRELQRLLEKAANVLDAPETTTDLESLLDDGSTSYDLDEVLDDVAIYIDCLMDLSLALENPVVDFEPGDHARREVEKFDVVSSKAEAFCRRIRDRFSKMPKMEHTKKCLAELEAWPRAANAPDVIIIIGRTGAGKSSLMEDLTNSLGHTKESLDSVTMDFAIDKAVITGHPYFIMDTPGFDAHQQEHAFNAIVRGIRAVHSAHHHARIAGILYVTCINQPRFEDLDRQLFRFVRAFCGDTFVKRGLVFVTTFWTANSEGQKSAFQSKLQLLQTQWKEGEAVAIPAFYNHGRGYRADGELDDSFVDWFTESGRDQIARHAREMVARCYGDSDTYQTIPATLRIIQELDAGTPAQETEAGKLLGLTPQQRQQAQPNTGNGANGNGPSPRTGPPGGPGPDGPAGTPGDLPREPETPPDSSPPSLVDTFLKSCNWFFNNVNFSAKIDPGSFYPSPTGGPIGGLSVVDVMKSFGMDSSREARLRYATEHGIQGVPLSAQFNDAMRKHVMEHNG